MSCLLIWWDVVFRVLAPQAVVSMFQAGAGGLGLCFCSGHLLSDPSLLGCLETHYLFSHCETPMAVTFSRAQLGQLSSCWFLPGPLRVQRQFALQVADARGSFLLRRAAVLLRLPQWAASTSGCCLLKTALLSLARSIDHFILPAEKEV